MGLSALVVFMFRSPLEKNQIAVNQPDTIVPVTEQIIREDKKQSYTENQPAPVAPPQVAKIEIVEDDIEINEPIKEEVINNPVVLPDEEPAYEVITSDFETMATENALETDDDVVVEDVIGGVKVNDEESMELPSQSNKSITGQNIARKTQAMDNESETAHEEQVFMVVEQMPEFPGGEEALYKFLATNIQYPQMAKDSLWQGRVFITFVIEKDGTITDVRVLRGVANALNEEAIRVVKSMPRWSPGTQRGKPVRVQYNLPIKFTLN
jgi:TonB family protein